MLNVIPLEYAKSLVTKRFVNSPKCETAPLKDAVGRLLFEDVFASENVPSFSRSTVDGYAVIAADTFGCSEHSPALLRYKGEVKMGDGEPHAIQKGECMYVPTGGELPKGADAMVMIEYAERFSGDTVCVVKPSAPFSHVIFEGDDIKKGALVLQKGRLLRAADIGTLAALGVSAVNVIKKPRVGVISTGDELVPPCETPKRGCLRDINGDMLCAALIEAGCESVFLGICKDDERQLEQLVSQAGCDMLLISGGSSVGERDATAAVLSRLGELVFHGLALKPGKPTLCGDIGYPAFGLPGHPVAAYFVFELLVKPLLYSWQGREYSPAFVNATLSFSVPSNNGREELVAVSLKDGAATPLISKSGLISALSRADGYIRIPRDSEGLAAGSAVIVYIFGERL